MARMAMLSGLSCWKSWVVIWLEARLKGEAWVV
jgi:hypothetical protein